MDHDLQERLIAAGRELLEEGGIPAVTVREAARRCGVSHGAPRRYFPTLGLLLAAVAERCITELRASVMRSDFTSAQAAWAYVQYAVAHPHAFDLFTRHDILAASGWNLRSASVPLLMDWHARFQQDTPGATPTQSASAWAGIHGVATLASRRTFDVFDGVSPQEVLEELLSNLGLDH